MAWFMLHRLRKAWEQAGRSGPYGGPVEIDETYIGGTGRNKHCSRKLKAGRGPVGKTLVVGIKDRDSNSITASPMKSVSQNSVGKMIRESVGKGSKVYINYSSVFARVDNHESVNHSMGEHVRRKVYTNGVESFWWPFKRGFHGTYHHMSPKHLHRYVNEFAGRHAIRHRDTIDQMRDWVAALVGKPLLDREPVK